MAVRALSIILGKSSFTIPPVAKLQIADIAFLLHSHQSIYKMFGIKVLASGHNICHAHISLCPVINKSREIGLAYSYQANTMRKSGIVCAESVLERMFGSTTGCGFNHSRQRTCPSHLCPRFQVISILHRNR